MTYREIVEGMVARDSLDWVEDLVMGEGKVDRDVHTTFTKYNAAQCNSFINYDCLVTIDIGKVWNAQVRVVGYIDENGVHRGGIWDRPFRNQLWAPTVSERRQKGIFDFDLSKAE